MKCLETSMQAICNTNIHAILESVALKKRTYSLQSTLTERIINHRQHGTIIEYIQDEHGIVRQKKPNS